MRIALEEYPFDDDNDQDMDHSQRGEVLPGEIDQLVNADACKHGPDHGKQHDYQQRLGDEQGESAQEIIRKTAQEHRCDQAAAHHHLDVDRESEKGQLPAGIFGEDATDNLRLGMRQVEGHALQFRLQGNQRNDETEDVR